VILAKLNQLLQQTVDAPIQPNKYKARIERSNPTCLIFLVDQSESMENPFGNQPEKQKAQEVAAAINALLDNLVLKCKRQADIRDCNYCYIGLLGYSGKQVRPGLSGPLAGKVLVTPADLDEHCTRTEVQDVKEPDGKGGFLVKKKRRRIWLEPKAEYETPMRSAFNRTREIVSEFVKEYPNCFPPIVMNFTDGQPTENPTEAARELCQVRSEDGNVLLFNAHVSSTRLLPIRFPCGSENLPADDPYAFLMFHLSSVLPGTMIQLVQNMPNPPKAGAHGFVFNGDLQTVLQFLAIGTSNAFFAKV
jgi:hypothetical protein